ncbi:MAG: metallophosphoesterase [Myxococcota bacterium]
MGDTLVVGDVHGCADELDALLDRVGPERVLLVGDLFTKGPHPERVWARIRDAGLRSVLGNHDQRLLDVMDGRRPHDRHGADVVAALDREDPAWRPFVRALPLFLDVDGAARPTVCVHAALHPSGDLARTTRRTATKLRRWPDDADGDPFWWEVYRGERGVVFGHDAARGLVRREERGRAWLVGLDTGCVYGGQLSGWVPERDVVVQVPAREAYAPFG